MRQSCDTNLMVLTRYGLVVAGIFGLLSAHVYGAEVDNPPEITELEPIVVEGKRFEEEVQRIEEETKRFQESMERSYRPDKTEVSEQRDNSGNTTVRVRTRWSTYCLQTPGMHSNRNEHGATLAVPTNCPDR